MSDFLDQMAVGSRERLTVARNKLSEAALLQRARAAAPAPRLRAAEQRFDLIAELKLRSPAVGQLKSAGEDADDDNGFPAAPEAIGEAAFPAVSGARTSRLHHPVLTGR